MISDDYAKQLHDRATCGGTLSPKDQSLLEKWYESQDIEEFEALNLKSDRYKGLADLQNQVEKSLKQLSKVTKHIQDISSENDSLRCEIADLRRQLAHPSSSLPA